MYVLQISYYSHISSSIIFIIKLHLVTKKIATYALYPHTMYSRYSIPDGIHKPSASVIAVLNESLNDHSEYLSHGQSPESEYIKLL